MARMAAYRLANAKACIPMPDRGGRLFSATPEGEVIDVENRFYTTLIADKDLIPVETKPKASANKSHRRGK
jgi:hypothetical protein